MTSTSPRLRAVIVFLVVIAGLAPTSSLSLSLSLSSHHASSVSPLCRRSHHSHRPGSLPAMPRPSTLQRPASPSASSTSTTTALHGRKKRGGVLGNNVSLDDDGNVKFVSNKMKQNRLGSAKKKDGKSKRGGGGDDGDGDSVVISPLLAEWAARGEGEGAREPTSERGRRGEGVGGGGGYPPPADLVVAGASGGRPRDGAMMDDVLGGIEATLSTTNFDVRKLVVDIASLTKLGSGAAGNGNVNDRVLLPTIKSLLSSGKTTSSYRLAWVGSDAAVCHVGTSLHKVPLARLQEVYLSLGGGGGVGINRNRWELFEVIRILGPFPNVRNTLRGNVVGLTKSGMNEEREGVRMDIAYTSMIDGTGKELLASSGGSGGGKGKGDGGAKHVNLDVWFANDRAIVCTVPPSDEDDGGGDPLGGNGSKILYFVAVDDLEGELEKLRAA
ncbi:hypothetical protein ACHAW5_001655 [Stephanodiscus triporus]|uniref:Uncharacterized protein n=1 Tax=Stephanodiscus triporus TaxID=2934178 RepID=A0ABD3QGB7_9STRA